MKLDKQIVAMQKSVDAFVALDPQDRWFVASILLRKDTQAFNKALTMTPELEWNSQSGTLRRKP